MKSSQETFLGLVNEAHKGILKLPAFQRGWTWKRGQVMALYDSVRKKFPIGSFLFLEGDTDYNLSPKAFEGAFQIADSAKFTRLALDGQQRITSGIALVHGPLSNNVRFFLDLQALKKLSEAIGDSGLDYHDKEAVRRFVQEIDEGDGYIVATTKQTELRVMLLESHLLSSTYLMDEITLNTYLEEYEAKYPGNKDFLSYVVKPYFRLDTGVASPVTILTKEESLSAVTRIFATINTTGKKLTPIELVTAILYAYDINLKKRVIEYHDESDYLENMDASGEILLQTIALLAKKTPKKSELPKTITPSIFQEYHEEALDLLDWVGAYLTKELGVGFKDTGSLIPYDSMLAPMAVVFKRIRKLEGAKKIKAEQKIEKWFIGAALSQRYQEGVHNKQDNDAKDFTEWVTKDNDQFQPIWLTTIQIPKTLKNANPNGALGKLVRCLINKEKPVDPLDEIKIGYYEDADEIPQEHHIFPKKFCINHISDWDTNHDKTEYALNFMPISSKTNKLWEKSDPKIQIDDIKAKIQNVQKVKEILRKLYISDECVKIMSKTNKTRKDYYDFLEARYRLIRDKLSQWGFSEGEELLQEENTEE